VGVDIACRMKLTVVDLPPRALDEEPDRLTKALERETRFGVGAEFRDRRAHPVLDEDWSVTALTRELKDRAWSQLGTSGSGNHFVEFGVLTASDRSLGLEPGAYLALLSHSGSRGAGAQVAGHYSKLARERHPELPDELRYLAWLDLSSGEGQEYWRAMELMGKYAAANHACIHRHVVAALGAGVLGVIPGSMASSAYVVRGKGNPASLDSASHGAGRRMSRTQALKEFTWPEAKKVLEARGVTLLSAGLDEVPMVYKDIEEVMAAQTDLVEPLARFDPRLVKMAPSGEPAED
jgi:tRNA-splicing ligase RtcB